MSGSREYSALRCLGEKLELEASTIKKAQEYYRLCCVKSNVERINDIPKGILCLDLAARNVGVAFDKETAVKLSTLSPALYQKYYNLIERSLELNEILNIPKLCVKLNCSEAKDLAEMIISKYQANNITHDDFNHPQYNAVAVYTACKLKGIKITKQQFLLESQLRPLQWKQLESKFFEFVKNAGLDNCLKKSKKTENYEEVSEKSASVTEIKNISKEDHQQEEIEDYEVWKARVLKEANQALGKH